MSEAGQYVPSPRPNPRLRPEGAAYAERNRGTMERWFDYSDTMEKSGETVATGTGGDVDAAVEEEGGRGVETSSAAKYDGEGVEDHPPSSPQGVGECEGEGVRELVDRSKELSLSSAPARGPAEEAKEYALRNRGQMDHIINNYRVPSPTHTSSAAKDTHTQGTETGPPPSSPPSDSARQRTLHQESQGRTWDETRPAPRIRADGESIAMKNSTDSMFGILRTDDSPQGSPVKTPTRLSRHSEESAPPTQSSTGPRARPGEGMKNYERAHDQSEISAIMRGEGASRSAQPRNIRHLQRSELW